MAVTRWWPLALTLAACSSDPTLKVIVEHPSGLAVANTVISVYESASITCQQVEYGDVSDAALAAATVAEETVGSNAQIVGNLSNLSRTDPKIIVARGYGNDGKLVAAGCAEKDVVSGADQIKVITEVSAIVSLALVDPNGSSDRYGVRVAVADSTGQPIDQRQIWWRVYGPSGSKPYDATGLTTMIDGTQADGTWEPTSPLCTSKGLTNIHPMPPSTVGGYAIKTRIAWAATPVPLFTQFTGTDLASQTLHPPGPVLAPMQRPCAIGRDAAGSVLACLETSGTSVVANVYTITIDNATGATTISPKNTPVTWPGPSFPVAIYSLPNGTALDVLAVEPNAKVSSVFGTTAPAPCTPLAVCNTLAIDDAYLAPTCDTDPARLILHDSNPVLIQARLKEQLKAIPAAGGSVALFDAFIKSSESNVMTTNLEINSAGCSTKLDATGSSSLVQVVAVNVTQGKLDLSTRVNFSCTGACSYVELPIPGGTIGYTGGTGSHVIAPTVDATGVVLTSSVLASLNGNNTLLELDRVSAAGQPHRLVAGQFDKDTGLDLLWDIVTARGGSLLDVSYSRTIDDNLPLAALSPQLRVPIGAINDPLNVNDLLSADLNGDGIDDLVLVAQLAGLGTVGMSVLPVGVPAPVTSLMTDSNSCAP